MAKKRLKITFRLDEYCFPRLAWRTKIYKRALEAAETTRVIFSPQDKLQLIIRLYLTPKELLVHDVDNRAKDVMDSLQGRLGGPKSKCKRKPIIPNDNQVYKLVVEKLIAPAQSGGLGHVTVRKHSPRKRRGN